MLSEKGGGGGGERTQDKKRIEEAQISFLRGLKRGLCSNSRGETFTQSSLMNPDSCESLADRNGFICLHNDYSYQLTNNFS